MSRRLKMNREADAKAIQADKRKPRNGKCSVFSNLFGDICFASDAVLDSGCFKFVRSAAKRPE